MRADASSVNGPRKTAEADTPPAPSKPIGAPPRTRPGPGWRRKLLFAALVNLLLLGSLEALVRITAPPRQPAPFRGTEDGLILAPGFRGLYARVPVSINSWGIRDTELGPPAPEELRVLCLGDSNTFGLSLPDPHPYPRRLEEHLQAATGRPVRVLNAGVPGADLRNGLELFHRLLPVFKPHVVTFSFNFNNRHLSQRSAGAMPAWLRLDMWLFGRSALYAYMVNRMKGFAWPVPLVPKSYEDLPFWDFPVRISPEEHERLLKAAIAEARAAGAGAVLIQLEENPAFIGPLQQSLARLEQGDGAGAREALEQYSRRAHNPRHQYYAPISLYLERQIAALEGKTWPPYLVAGRAPFYLVRLRDEYDQAERELNRRFGVPLVTLPAAAWNRPRAFFDICHFDAELHDLLAQAAASAVLEALGVRAAQGPAAGSSSSSGAGSAVHSAQSVSRAAPPSSRPALRPASAAARHSKRA
jgi:hypothetical protein